MAYTPGTLNTGQPPSTPAGFSSTVAGAIEQKVHDLVLALTGKAPFDVSIDDADARARRVLFVAIAEAVFEHLRDHADSITTGTASVDNHTHTIGIQVSE
jgi:hypothetical protein